MKIEKVDAANPSEKVLERAVKLINRGEVIVCPTDTGYAFSVNALDTRAVARVFGLKGRAFSNPIHIAVGSIEEADNYAQVTEQARYLAAHYLPGALTLVLRKKENIPSLLVAGLNTIGIRIPNNKIILSLIKRTGKPLTTTSANLSGKPTPFAISEITAQFGDSLQNVALLLDQGTIAGHELSTIIDLSANPPQLIRQGRVSWMDIREALQRFENN